MTLFDHNGAPLAGFRLHRLEVLNWGTFNGLYSLDFQGGTTFLTGENGSGKSTLVDALLTLLVPNQGRSYNQAAGGERKRERSELSYVRGAYGKVQQEDDYSARTQYLRDESSYSVLLAYFRNEGYEQEVTLAQFFWLNNGVNKFHVIATRELSIESHFTDFVTIRELKARLRKLSDVTVEDKFNKYSKQFRKLFGLRSSKALDLFNQTVTIKEIGALNDFVRTHMLERSDALEKVAQLQEHYENLMVAYSAIQKAEDQLALLRPILSEARKYEQALEELADLEGCKAALPIYFVGHKYKLLQQELALTQRQHEQYQIQAQQEEALLHTLREKRDSLKLAISTDEVGQRLRDLEREIGYVSQERHRRQTQARRYEDLARLLALPGYRDEIVFQDSRRRATALRTENERRLSQLKEALLSEQLEADQLRRERAGVATEIESLKGRKSQIPAQQVRLRAQILAALGIDESEVPFIGELLKVKESERQWEGAIERLLHNFGLRLLVPERHYQQFRGYVNETHLGGRLVFHRILDRKVPSSKVAAESDALLRKLQIKPDSVYYPWIEHELHERFNYTCCEEMTQFERASHAITPAGLIKGGREQHEKDDRYRIDDRRHYILGWNNDDKIRSLEAEQATLDQKLHEKAAAIQHLEQQQREAHSRTMHLGEFLSFTVYADLDWRNDEAKLALLHEEQTRLRQSSDRVRQLSEELEKIEAQLQDAIDRHKEMTRAVNRAEYLIQNHQQQIRECQNELREVDHEAMKGYAPRIQAHIQEDVTISSVDRLSRQVGKHFDDLTDSAQRRMNNHKGKLTIAMQKYKDAYPIETTDFDTSVESIPEFDRELARIEHDDLPQYRQRFKGLLNQKIIDNITLLRADLDGYVEDLKENIANLNESLHKINYTPDTYIQLQTRESSDPEIRDFKAALKACIPDVGQPRSEATDEESFQKVRPLIMRFKEEVRWTAKVTDARYWLTFAAVERYRADDSQKHYYSDSSGKSGGQKAKLAYTILASAIAFQFGLEVGETHSKSLRFVVIDEAFSRSDENNSRYAMQLFKELNLQLLVVTPQTGIHIVEPFIATCHFVWNNAEGNDSRLLSMTRSEFEVQREAHQRSIRQP